jgi:hypothetical protein
MENSGNIKLTSAEMASLWISYQNDTMSICVMKHFLCHIDDEEIREVLEYALHLSEQHIKTVTEFMKKEDFPIPHGFTENDVNLRGKQITFKRSCSYGNGLDMEIYTYSAWRNIAFKNCG